MHTTTYHRSADDHSLSLVTPVGVQRWDLSDLNRNQMDGVREMVVNDWCRRNDHLPLYPNA